MRREPERTRKPGPALPLAPAPRIATPAQGRRDHLLEAESLGEGVVDAEEVGHARPGVVVARVGAGHGATARRAPSGALDRGAHAPPDFRERETGRGHAGDRLDRRLELVGPDGLRQRDRDEVEPDVALSRRHRAAPVSEETVEVGADEAPTPPPR
jgi:hypothetical protein